MKAPAWHRRRLLVECAGILAAHFGLLQIMAHTRIVERVMAMQFNGWELLVILLFFVARFLAYFVVPAVVAMVIVSASLDRVGRRQS